MRSCLGAAAPPFWSAAPLASPQPDPEEQPAPPAAQAIPPAAKRRKSRLSSRPSPTDAPSPELPTPPADRNDRRTVASQERSSGRDSDDPTCVTVVTEGSSTTGRAPVKASSVADTSARSAGARRLRPPSTCSCHSRLVEYPSPGRLEAAR